MVTKTLFWISVIDINTITIRVRDLDSKVHVDLCGFGILLIPTSSKSGYFPQDFPWATGASASVHTQSWKCMGIYSFCLTDRAWKPVLFSWVKITLRLNFHCRVTLWDQVEVLPSTGTSLKSHSCFDFFHLPVLLSCSLSSFLWTGSTSLINHVHRIPPLKIYF